MAVKQLFWNLIFLTIRLFLLGFKLFFKNFKIVVAYGETVWFLSTAIYCTFFDVEHMLQLRDFIFLW